MINTAGGKRQNAGRKKGEAKKAVGIRVLVRFLKQCQQAAKNEEQKLIELERQNSLTNQTNK